MGERIAGGSERDAGGRVLGRWMPWAAFVVAAAVALFALLRPGDPRAATCRHPLLGFPAPGASFSLSSVETVALALSPDGSQLGFVASG